MANTLKEKLLGYGTVLLVTTGIFGSWGYSIYSREKNPFKDNPVVVRYHKVKRKLSNLEQDSLLVDKLKKALRDKAKKIAQHDYVKSYFDYNKRIDSRAAIFGATAISLGFLSYFGYCLSKRRRE